VIAHIVLFEPKPELDPDRLRSFARSVIEGLRSIPSIRRARIGKAIFVDPGYQRVFGDKTYKYAAVLEFENRDGLVAYLRHPQHDRIGREFWNSCAFTTIVEVETMDPLTEDIPEIFG
jgi:hypothetical protein